MCSSALKVDITIDTVIVSVAYMLVCKYQHIWWSYRYIAPVGWLVALRIYVDLAIFQPYLDLEAGDNHSLKFQMARPGIEPRSSCSASQELNHSTTTAPLHCSLFRWFKNKFYVEAKHFLLVPRIKLFILALCSLFWLFINKFYVDAKHFFVIPRIKLFILGHRKVVLPVSYNSWKYY